MPDITSIRRDILGSEILRLCGKPVIEWKQVDYYMVYDVLLEGDKRIIVRFEQPSSEERLTRNMYEQASVLDALHDIYRIPVPIVHYVQPNKSVVGMPWMLMERIPGDKLGNAAVRWKEPSREANMTLVFQQMATIYTRIFETPIPRSPSRLFREEHQHRHIDSMPAAFDIVLQYESPSSDPAILEARRLRQETATFIAHRFWYLMHDSVHSAESEGHPELPVLHKLKALVPAFIPSVEQYLADHGLIGSKRLHHFDPSVTNIMVDPSTAEITGIVDWEYTMAIPALLSAAYPEWIRYDGKLSAMWYWSSQLLELSRDTHEYGKWRDMYDEIVGKLSPSYLKVLRAGRQLKELLDWAYKSVFGRPLDQRMVFLDEWADKKAAELGVDVSSVPILRKKDWL